MNHKKQLLENTIIIAIGKLSTQIISYLLLPLFTAKLAPSEYGVYDFVCTLGIFLYPFLSFLMEESMFRFLIDAKSETEKKKIVSQTMIFMSGATLAFIPVSIIIFNLFTKYNADFIFAFIIFIVSNLGILLVNCLLRGESKIKLYSVSNFILGVITVILDLVFILGFKTGAEGLLWANTISNLITTIIIAYKLKQNIT